MKQTYMCRDCGENIAPERVKLGYYVCMDCGEDQAILSRKTWTIAPVHKSNYMLITSKDQLKGLNNKGGNVK